MKHLVRIARVQKRGEAVDSGLEMISYWLSKTPGERIKAAEDLRRDAYKLINGRDLPPLGHAATVIKRTRP